MKPAVTGRSPCSSAATGAAGFHKFALMVSSVSHAVLAVVNPTRSFQTQHDNIFIQKGKTENFHAALFVQSLNERFRRLGALVKWLLQNPLERFASGNGFSLLQPSSSALAMEKRRSIERFLAWRGVGIHASDGNALLLHSASTI